MKIKLLIGTALSLLMVLSVSNVSAQKGAKRPGANKSAIQSKKTQLVKANHKGNMAQAYKFLKRTNKVIVAAHKAVNTGGNHTGNLAKAVHHQRHAKKLLKLHKAHRAVQHSRVARKYAMLAIRENKGTFDNSLSINAEEKKLMGKTIADAELEKELKAENPKLTFDDKSISEKDMTEIEVLEMDVTKYKND